MLICLKSLSFYFALIMINYLQAKSQIFIFIIDGHDISSKKSVMLALYLLGIEPIPNIPCIAHPDQSGPFEKLVD